jgi:NADPH-dependent curcumin reductase CurA
VPIPEPGDGQFVAAVTHISIDPAMRGWMNAGRSYIPPVGIGEVMRALSLGRVIDSRKDQFAVGELVQGTFGVTKQALRDGAAVHKISPVEGISPSAHLGVLTTVSANHSSSRPRSVSCHEFGWLGRALKDSSDQRDYRYGAPVES